MEAIYNGYQALLRGALEAGVGCIVIAKHAFSPFAAVEGLPSSELPHMVTLSNSVSAINYAMGVSLSGVRALAVVDDISFAAMALLGRTGVGAGLVVAYCQPMHAPYLDIRLVADGAHIPVMLPSTVYEAKTYVKMACNVSEKYDMPLMVSLTDTLQCMQSSCVLAEPKTLMDKPYKREIEKFVPIPSSLRLCAEDVVVRDKRLREDCESFSIFAEELRDRRIGVVCTGSTFAALREGVPHVSTFRLGLYGPLPLGKIRHFSHQVEEVIVLEEGEPLVERALKSAGIECHGADVFEEVGSYTPDYIKQGIVGTPAPAADDSLPIRTPGFCASCPLIALFNDIKQADCAVCTSTRCGILASSAPLSHLDIAHPQHALALASGYARKSPMVCVLAEEEVLDNLSVLSESSCLIVVYGADYETAKHRMSTCGYDLQLSDSFLADLQRVDATRTALFVCVERPCL